MDTVKNYALLALAILVVVLSSAVAGYRKLYMTERNALKVQSAAIESTNRQADTLLKLRTKERDALQDKLDAAAKAQEKTDEAGKAQITADSKRDVAAPVRVRYVNAGCGRGSAPSQGTAPTSAGGGNAGTAGGVLAPEASELFKRDQDAVEKLQLAFNSCRARLVKE